MYFISTTSTIQYIHTYDISNNLQGWRDLTSSSSVPFKLHRLITLSWTSVQYIFESVGSNATAIGFLWRDTGIFHIDSADRSTWNKPPCLESVVSKKLSLTMPGTKSHTIFASTYAFANNVSYSLVIG